MAETATSTSKSIKPNVADTNTLEDKKKIDAPRMTNQKK
jgi:hypothetical protein